MGKQHGDEMQQHTMNTQQNRDTADNAESKVVG
jgi:hypothetical protein